MNFNQQIEQWLDNNKLSFDKAERPFVTLSYAQSLDGSIAIHSGEPLALSGTESLKLTHHLRSMHDGILVGIGTVLSDDPQLTVRHWSGENPQPIVLDSQLRIPKTARLCQLEDKRCWVLTLEDENIEIDGLEISSLKSNAEGRVCLQHALTLLWQKGIKSLMVEGGANVITAFLKAQLADAIVVTITPTLVGGYKAVSDLGVTSKLHLPQVSPVFTEKLGDDFILWGNLQYGERA